MDPRVRMRDHEFRGDSLLPVKLRWTQRNEEIVKHSGRTRRTTPFDSVDKTTEDHRQKQCRGRRVCSRIWSVRSERGPEHDV